MALCVAFIAGAAQAQIKPNIMFIMGDDIGMWNIGATSGLMAGEANLDKLAKEGMLFTDYYAEASCTAGRELHHGRASDSHGMTTVGQAGAKIGIPAEATTPRRSKRKATRLASSVKIISAISMSFAYRPWVRRVFRLPYHLDAMETPRIPTIRRTLDKVGPCNMVHHGRPTPMPPSCRAGAR